MRSKQSMVLDNEQNVYAQVCIEQTFKLFSKILQSQKKLSYDLDFLSFSKYAFEFNASTGCGLIYL